MRAEYYITEEEQKRCARVAEAFKELFEIKDTIVLNAEKYGFVKLQYYTFPYGFDTVVTYTNSKEMFEDLWQDWFANQLLSLAAGTGLEELEYEEIFKCLPKEKQDEIMKKQAYFKKKSEIL